MSQLGLFAYLIGVIPSFGTTLAVIGFVSIVISGSCLLGSFMSENDPGFNYGRKNDPERAEWHKSFRKKFVRLIAFVSVPAFLISNLLPDRSTMVTIAAAEVGQRVFQSEKVQSVVDPSVDLLKTWIQAEVENQKKRLADAQKK